MEEYPSQMLTSFIAREKGESHLHKCLYFLISFSKEKCYHVLIFRRGYWMRFVNLFKNICMLYKYIYIKYIYVWCFKSSLRMIFHSSVEKAVSHIIRDWFLKVYNLHVSLLSISTYLHLVRKKQKVWDGHNLPRGLLWPIKLFWEEKYQLPRKISTCTFQKSFVSWWHFTCLPAVIVPLRKEQCQIISPPAFSLVAQWPETGIRDPQIQAEARALNGAALSESHANEIRKGGNVELQPWAAKQLAPASAEGRASGGQGGPRGTEGMRMLLSWQERERELRLS